MGARRFEEGMHHLPRKLPSTIDRIKTRQGAIDSIREVPSRRKALLTRHRGRAPYQLINLRRDLRTKRRRWRLPTLAKIAKLDRGITTRGVTLTRQHLKEQDAGGEDIRPMIHGKASKTLWGQITWFAKNHVRPRMGQLHMTLRQTKIRELDMPVVGDEEIRRRDVTMHEAKVLTPIVRMPMTIIEPLEKLTYDEERRRNG